MIEGSDVPSLKKKKTIFPSHTALANEVDRGPCDTALTNEMQIGIIQWCLGESAFDLSGIHIFAFHPSSLAQL